MTEETRWTHEHAQEAAAHGFQAEGRALYIYPPHRGHAGVTLEGFPAAVTAGVEREDPLYLAYYLNFVVPARLAGEQITIYDSAARRSCKW